MQKVLLRTPILPLNAAYAASPYISNLLDCGLYLSSVALHAEVEKQTAATGAEKEKLRQTLSKYQIRASTRATPYATFAGLATATAQDRPTSIVLQSEDKHCTKLRLDMNLLAQIVDKLKEEPHIKKQLKFSANNSLYVVPGGYRYAEYVVQNGVRKYHLSFLAATPYLEKILHAARNPSLLSELGTILRAETNAADEDVQDYLGQLIEGQVLLSELEPTITGQDPLTRLIEKLKMLSGAENTVSKLLAVHKLLERKSVLSYSCITSKSSNA